MAARVQTVSTNASATTPLNVTLPSGSVVGDLIIACCSNFSDPSTAPTGFTAIGAGTLANGENGGIQHYYKIADSTLISAGSVDFASTLNESIVGALVRITGHKSVSPVGTPTTGTNSGTATTNATITLARSEDMVLTIGGSADDDTWSVGAADGGITVSEKVDALTALGSDASLTVSQLTRANAGATGTITITRSGSLQAMAAISVLITGYVDISVNETVTLNETWTVARIISVIVTETITLTEAFTTTISRAWTNVVKNVSSWMNIDKK